MPHNEFVTDLATQNYLISKSQNVTKSFKYWFDSCPARPTKIYEGLQVVGFEGPFWFEVILLKENFKAILISRFRSQ